ncbi:MAG: bifunctional metallophosphatase/5'-nucleotidase, partial [Clostridia bacterium]|nr:bifunctional metallophosphatase/5'-nucleotidase [Clostridia bacterium]
MKKRFRNLISLTLALCLAVSLFTGIAFAKDEDTVVILYENDVHCALEGYSKLSAMKKELSETYANVGAVSCGDYVQGSSLGVISKGEYVVNIMNLVGYDALTIGNHEFDYRLPRLDELVGMMNTKPVSCNFQRIGEENSYFQPYSIVSYGSVDIAYVGITTPHTLSSSSPAQFKDEQGNYIYTFNAQSLYSVVQKSIDSAKQAGADYVIALSHIGYEEGGDQYEDIVDLVQNTRGLDVVLDGHSHSVIENMKLTDKDGNQVVLTSTGTKFEHIGKLTIKNGTFTTQLIKTENYVKTDPSVDAYLKKINEDYATLGERKIGVSGVDLITNDKDGKRLVRTEETNLGDLCADAYRKVTGADIGYANGGGIRAPIAKGDVTFNDVLSVFPFNNQVVVAQMKGQVIQDFLETSVKYWPVESGAFPHMSGLTFSINTAIESSVSVDENGVFAGIYGPYRVYNIKVLNKETGVYEPIDLNKEYTFASHNYYLLECGDGMKMFEGVKILQNDGMLDVELLETYIVEHLGGVIGQEYAAVQKSITFTEGESSVVPEQSKTESSTTPSATSASPTNTVSPPTGDTSEVFIWILAAGVSLFPFT